MVTKGRWWMEGRPSRWLEGKCTDGKSGWKATVSGRQMWWNAGRKWLMEGKDEWKDKGEWKAQVVGMAGRQRILKGKCGWKA
jgi:hypothetical protein